MYGSIKSKKIKQKIAEHIFLFSIKENSYACEITKSSSKGV